MKHIADNQDALLDYLYEEGDPEARLSIKKHLQECAPCSIAVLELQTVRGMLGEWSPPASELGFRIVQDHAGPGATATQQANPRGAWAGHRMSHPGLWAQAAAALLLFGAGMAVSQLDVDYSGDALVVRARSAAPAPASAVRNASIVLPPSPDAAAETARVDVASASSPTPTSDRLASTDELLQRVRAMIEQSEVRQQRELALRLSQVSREVDTQHRADVQRIQQNIGQFEMETGAQINQQQQQMEYLVRTSGGQK
jgi:hypothetical protein